MAILINSAKLHESNKDKPNVPPDMPPSNMKENLRNLENDYANWRKN